MTSLPTYYPSDKEIVIQMLETLEIMSWNYDHTIIRLEEGKAYKIPSRWAKELQKQGYCYFTEAVE